MESLISLTLVTNEGEWGVDSQNTMNVRKD